MNKKSLIFIISSLLALSVFFDISMSTAKAEEADFFEQQKLTSYLLINLFLETIDQGGLVIFEHTLIRSDLQSHQVSYVHNIVDDSLSVRLCFKLQKKIIVPDFKGFYVDRITVETDKSGNVVQVITHVSSLDKEGSK